MLFNKFRETLEAVVYIALHSAEKPVTSKELCKRHSVSPRHFEPIMQALVHHGILRGSKGPKGGYTLAREKRKIKAGDIFRLVLKIDYHTKKPKQTYLGHAVILPFIRDMKQELVRWLDETTIEDLVKQSEDLYQVQKSSDFNI